MDWHFREVALLGRGLYAHVIDRQAVQHPLPSLSARARAGGAGPAGPASSKAPVLEALMSQAQECKNS